MQPIISNFDFSTFSFHGHSLIEASAGTGKTYTIVILYLRLLLGINNKNFMPALTIEKILVVTFTRVAAKELRERIRVNIRELKVACIVGYSTNILFSNILKEIPDLNLAYWQLLAAEHKIDQASIFTIHGFCQHILNMFPIELNSEFRYRILENEECLVQKACNDFWRIHFYPLPVEIVNIIQDYWNSPQDLLNDIHPYLYNLEINILPVFTKDFLTCHRCIITCINSVKTLWINIGDKLLEFIKNNVINHRVYNIHNMSIWLNIINLWAKTITINYTIPNELHRFKYSTIINYISHFKNNKIFQYYFLFELIEKLFKKTLSLKQLVLSTAIYEIRKNLKNIKQKSSEIGFSDLIFLLDTALHSYNKKEELLKLIRTIYPIAIIDEFQDTDFQQYRIFNTLYASSYHSKLGLLLIGDPKQSIYSFRGADIFSYLLARKNVDFYYTLSTNWRASESMVNAINKLFQSSESFCPFVFRDIPFIPIHAAKNNKELRFIVKNRSYPALSFYLPSCDQLTIHEYRKVMAFQCAITIRDLLHNADHGHIWLQTSANNKRRLQVSDLVILVRDRYEGYLMSSVLENMNICNVYLSNQENVFKTVEAQDLLLILQAVLNPEKDNVLRCALITSIIGYDFKKIEFINHNEHAWRKEVEEFSDYFLFWKKYGVQSMLQEIIFRRYIFQNLLTTKNGRNSLVNILHLSEILQKYSIQLHNEYALIRWLKIKINSHNLNSDDQLLRLTSEYPLVKIITIHQSKGLEFPLVFVPFISNFYKRKYPLFHDRKDYRIYLDLSNNVKSIDLYNQERLSEDLRLLYVAITRAIYHCFIGVGFIVFKKNMKKKHYSKLHHTALGYLIQNGIPGDFKFFEDCLIKLVESSQGDMMLNYIDMTKNEKKDYKLLSDVNIVNINIPENKILSAKNLKKQIHVAYTVTSYSELSHFCKSPILLNQHSKLNKEIIYIRQNNEKSDILFTPHTFPQGKNSGDFLHHIFQKWVFNKGEINDEWLSWQLSKYNIDLIWLPILKTWINEIVSVPLNQEKLMLSELLSSNYSVEFQFYISVNNHVSAKEFDRICKKHDSISRLSSPLLFPNIIGMLHGFIDLIFFWQGKYYLLDYKSNWLGNMYNDYSKSTMKCEMIIRHYALQYQIYTLALHRFLRHRLISYNYQKDFGGVYYLFLRGMNLMYPGCGIYFCRPEEILIDKLDRLLSLHKN